MLTIARKLLPPRIQQPATREIVTVESNTSSAGEVNTQVASAHEEKHSVVDATAEQDTQIVQEEGTEVGGANQSPQSAEQHNVTDFEKLNLKDLDPSTLFLLLLVRTVVVSSSYTGIAQPFERWLSRFQSGLPLINPEVIKKGDYQCFLALYTGFLKSQQIGNSRGVFVANRENVAATLHGERTKENTKYSWSQIAITAGVLNAWETGALAYWRNTRSIMYIDGPLPLTMRDKLRVAKLNLLSNWTIGSLGIAGYFVCETTAEAIKMKYGCSEKTANYTGTAITAGTVGAVTNAMRIVQRNSLKLAVENSYVPPNYSQVCKDIYTEKGVKGFTRGFPAAFALTFFAYMTFRKIENVMDKHVMPGFISKLRDLDKTNRFFPCDVEDENRLEEKLDVTVGLS